MTDSSSRPTPTTAPTHLPDRRVRDVAVTLVVLGVIVAAALALWYATRPEAAFDFDQHTLCDWFTADELDRIVADAQAQAGVDVELGSFAAGGGCRVVRGGEMWDTRGRGLAIQLAPADIDFRGPTYRSTDPADFQRHRLLDNRVTVGNVSPAFVYSPGVTAHLRVVGHEEEVLFFGFGVEGTVLGHDSPQTVDLGLIVADAMLEHMNWTD